MNQKIIFLSFFLYSYTKAICNFGTDKIGEDNQDSYIAYTSIICSNTSSEDYTYDTQQLIYDQNVFNEFDQLNIILLKSNFSVVKHLSNPFHLINRYIQEESYQVSLKISLSHIKAIEENAFKNFEFLHDLDLSFNEIEDLKFILDLSSFLKNLNLGNNKISHINFEYFAQKTLHRLDLSFNRLKEIDFLVTTNIINDYSNYVINSQRFPVQGFLNLDSNIITTINMFPTFEGWLDLAINLANNPLKNVKYCNPKLEPYFTTNLRLLNLSNSLTYLSVEDFTNCKLKFSNLIFSNNIINLDKHLDLTDFESQDFSNSSINQIPRHIFENKHFSFLNLSYNNLEFLNEPVFTNTSISESLDLSYCNIKNIDSIFQDFEVKYLTLRANNISELSSKSFHKIKWLDSLDMSYNNLFKVSKDDFNNCKSLKVLNLASNNISVIEEKTFENLQQLQILRLENNFLKTLKTNVFKPLTEIVEIYLENNELTSLQSGIFSSIPVQILSLSSNALKLIQPRAFHNLNDITRLNINNNKDTLRIENFAFSNMQDLHTINFSGSGLSAINLNIFSETPSLNIIDVRNNNIVSLDFSQYNKLDNLEEIHITLVTDLTSKTFLSLTFLKQLTFWNSNIKTIENRAFQGLFSLKSLQFQNSEIGMVKSQALNGLFELEHLDFSNSLKNKGTLGELMFEDLYSLKILNLSHQGLQKLVPNAFKGLKNLQNLYLNNNKLNNLQHSTFFGLKSVQFLDLSYNNLVLLDSGYFKGLDNLRTLNLSNNNINDLELGAFQHFPHLENLILRENNLTEFKVGTFSNLYNLLNLDLAQNSISNLLLESFLPLRSLSYLDLEFNNLKTFGEYSLIKNLKYLKWIGIGKNKWQCDFLIKMLATFRNNSIDYSSSNINFYDDNVEGIDCIDVCKYLLCLKDSHGIN